jgi:hypothetical protein
VKAIGWCPSNPSILASGGGTADRNIRFFSTNTLEQSFCIDTGNFLFNFKVLKFATCYFQKSQMKWLQLMVTVLIKLTFGIQIPIGNKILFQK